MMVVTLTLNPAVDLSIETSAPLRWNGVVPVRREVETPGGKGVNVAKVLAVNGQTTTAAGLLGRDRLACFKSFLEPVGIRCCFREVDHPTRVNLMITDGAGRELKVNRPGWTYPPIPFDEVMAFVRSVIHPGDWLLMGGSLPQGFPEDGYARLVRMAHEMNCLVGLDTSGLPLRLALSEKPDLLKPNRRELAEALGQRLNSERLLLRALASLSPHHEVIIVSDGPRGAWFASKGEILFAPSPPVDRKDSTGAGDSLFGQFCADYLPSRRLTPEITARAVAAGAAAVEQLGSPILSRQRIQELAAGVAVERR